MPYSYIFIALAAICNAIMDITMYRYSESVFFTENTFWNTWWSDRGKRHWIVQLNDGWHHFKMWMLGFFIIAITLAPYGLSFYSSFGNIGLLGDFLVLSVEWNLVFNMFYDKLLRRAFYSKIFRYKQ